MNVLLNPGRSPGAWLTPPTCACEKPETACRRDEPTDPLRTSWGYGARENLFNNQIAQAVTRWPEGEPMLDPRLFKALVAVESAFDPTAVSPTGAAGLVQLTPATATAHGLKLRPVDERKIPARALPVGVAVLHEKHRVITVPNPNTPYGAKVADAYQRLGPPTGDDLWHLDLAAYNGGGGTVLRAMARACDDGLDPRKWDNLIAPVDNPRQSPLYHAVKENFGEARALRKYREMAHYPRRILALRDRPV
ncbi:hypothetical protein DYH09_10065 [bacterium CPR1]|nr:hypothetical protein [bacterium CPR1]